MINILLKLILEKVIKNLIKIATVLKDEKNFEEAIDLYEKVIELDPKNVDAYFGKGIYDKI